MTEVRAMPSSQAVANASPSPSNAGHVLGQDVLNKIKEISQSYAAPDIYRRTQPGSNLADDLGVQIHDWAELRQRKERELLQAYGNAMQHANFIPTQGLPGGAATAADAVAYLRPSVRPTARLLKTTKSKSNSGRTYTSKFRGVHQTFPTRRWEAQFRRNGKPTSLGCFDLEEQAARAYDKMMLWCELHNSSGVKGGITNFDPTEYEGDIQWLQQVTQDELVAILRSDGRSQAASRTSKHKKHNNTGPFAAQTAAAALAAQQAAFGNAALMAAAGGVGSVVGGLVGGQADLANWTTATNGADTGTATGTATDGGNGVAGMESEYGEQQQQVQQQQQPGGEQQQQGDAEATGDDDVKMEN